jgi:hypothetical protein
MQNAGVHTFSENLGSILKLCTRERWRQPIYILILWAVVQNLVAAATSRTGFVHTSYNESIDESSSIIVLVVVCSQR